MSTNTGWIGVDLDGTLAHYDTWRGHQHIGAPIYAMVERVKGWLRAGLDVRIFTARVSGFDEKLTGEVRSSILKWLADNGLPPLEITNVKDYEMIELWDDRAVSVEENTGRPLAPSRRGLG